uniref:Coenzyme F420 hydrogenase/dehydrogenase, beta subunit C-terminal domain n=1 Tax=Flavobacterium sp. TaxID=239 RepID=UPI004049F051
MTPTIVKDNLCLGCGLCESALGKKKVSISFNKEGFLRPIFSKAFNPEDNKIFSNLCPGINVKHDSTKDHDPLWGPYLSITSGYAKNDKIRHSGSSGGGLTAIGTYLLEQNKVECILHIGPSIDKPYQNEYKLSLSPQDVLNNSGSRYAPSATLINLIEAVNNFSSIAVIGKPCDIVGVRNYIKQNPNAEEKIKYLLSFMCAGVPSQNATKEIIEQFHIKQDNVVSLRYRGEGWPGFFTIRDDKKRVHKMTYNKSWGTVLNKHLQFRCKICTDGTGEFADITCADAWESSENGYPSFEEKQGMSLIIIRNQRGKKLIDDALKLNYIGLSGKEYSSQDISKMQPYQKQRKQNLLARLLALKVAGRETPNYNKKSLIKAALKENPLRLIKNFVGMLKRI